MKEIVRFACYFLLSCSAAGCAQQFVKHEGQGNTFAELSVGTWRSNLMSQKRDIGMMIWKEPHTRRVHQDFVYHAVEFAKLNGATLPAISVDVEQLDDGSGEETFQPAEVVFDGSGLNLTGWNVLSFGFSEPTVWNHFKDKTSASAPFRMDSAPSVVRLVFNETERRIGVEFSEVVEGKVDPNPIEISGPTGTLNCVFAWGVPKNRASIACIEPLVSPMTITVLDGFLSANGNPVTAVDGSAFQLSVNIAEQSLQFDGLRAWTPATPAPQWDEFSWDDADWN